MDAQSLERLIVDRIKTILFLIVLTVGSAGANSFAGEAESGSPHVILLVVDGERYSEAWGSPGRENIPRRANELAPQGTMLTHCVNDGNTYTLPGHCSLLTGFNDELRGNGQDYPSHPSLFQLLVSKNIAADKVWLVTSKAKLNVLVNCADVAWKDRHLARTDCGNELLPGGNREDKDTMASARSILLKYQPKFMTINLKEPDIAAHRQDWNGYLKAIKDSDAMAADFWLWLQATSPFKDSTTLIITNDHGRHIEGRMEGYVSHGDGCSGCRHIGCLIIGPNIRRGAVIHERYTQRDIAATLAQMVGVQLLKSEGKPIIDIFTLPNEAVRIPKN